MSTETLDIEKQEKIIEKFDKELKTRKFDSKTMLSFVFYLSLAISLYHFITSFVGYPTTLKHRSLHVAMMLTMAFILYPANKKASRRKMAWYDVILVICSWAAPIYIWTHFKEIVSKMGEINTFDVAMGTLLILLIMEASRRISGWPLVILSLIFLIYALVGQHIPGLFQHRGFQWNKIVNHCFFNTEGIYGTSVSVASSYIFLFILFGAVMNKSGMGKFFNDIALAIAGKSKGGPAKVAVIASGFLGSINGSAVANVVTTGSFTIPLMKKTGYSGEFAGAAVATASVGGQLLPPVMGAAAFIMAEMLSVKYSQIVICATIPALLYYLGILMQIHLRAKKENFEGIDSSEILKASHVMKTRGYLLIPILFLLYMLLFTSRTVIFSASWTIVITIIITIIANILKKETRVSSKNIIDVFLKDCKSIVDAFAEAARSTVAVAIACAIVGIIIGVVSLTGFGLNMANAIIELGRANLFATLVLTMVTCMILGMGLPSIPAYLITATIAAPALVKLGIAPMAAHLFVFYFAMFANITPPVALASFASAGIADANPMKTGLVSVKLAAAGFIVPYMFIYNSGLLLMNVTWYNAIIVVCTAILGVFMISLAIEGYVLANVNIVLRIASMVGALLLISANHIQDLIGLGIFIVIVIIQKIKAKKIKSSAMF